MDKSRTKVLMVFHSMPQARIVKGLLESNNVQCFLSSEYPVFGTFFPGNDDSIRLYVMEDDYPTARNILMGEWQDDASEG